MKQIWAGKIRRRLRKFRTAKIFIYLFFVFYFLFYIYILKDQFHIYIYMNSVHIDEQCNLRKFRRHFRRLRNFCNLPYASKIKQKPAKINTRKIKKWKKNLKIKLKAKIN